MSDATLPIATHIAGKRISRSDVLAWEARRATKVSKQLGITAASTDVVAQRQALVSKKLELGHQGIERLLAGQLRWSNRLAGVVGALSRGRRRVCSIELTSSTGSAELLPQWYRHALSADGESLLLAGCPDHYILRLRSDGFQEVIETTGGSPLAMRILLDETDTSAAKTPADPAFPVQWVAVGRSASGLLLGAIRHQFRDEGGGFRARLTGEFPAATPPHLIRAHRWHLACEFSNWIEAANS